MNRDSDLGPEDMFDAALHGWATQRRRCGRVRQDDGACCTLPHRVVAVVHPWEMGLAGALGRTAAEATIGTTRGTG